MEYVDSTLLAYKVENAREAALRGPHSFPKERMLAVFWHLLASEEDDGGTANQQAGDVYMQITSLVSLRLLSRVRVVQVSESLIDVLMAAVDGQMGLVVS